MKTQHVCVLNLSYHFASVRT